MTTDYAILITGSIAVGSLVWVEFEHRRLRRWIGHKSGWKPQACLTFAVEALALAAIASTWYLASRL